MSIIESLIAALHDASDAPALRAKVAELEATVNALTSQVEHLTERNELLTKDVAFYFAMATNRQIKLAEDEWGIPGGG